MRRFPVYAVAPTGRDSVHHHNVREQLLPFSFMYFVYILKKRGL